MLIPRVNEQDEDDVDTVVQPDVLVVCDPKKIRLRGIWGAPELVVEILSPWTSRKDQREKFDLYQRIGVKEYWVVDPNGCWLQQYLLGSDLKFGVEATFEAGTLTCPTLPGLTIDVGELWKGLTPLVRYDANRLARECAKLDPTSEQAEADVGLDNGGFSTHLGVGPAESAQTVLGQNQPDPHFVG